MKKLLSLLLLTFIASMFFAKPASALTIMSPPTPATQLDYEAITNFDTVVLVNANGSLAVTEQITVNALHDQIKHGIYQDFTTSYATMWGTYRRTGFQIQKVLRDGANEQYFTESNETGLRIYIGDKNEYVPTGIHTYTIEYTTAHDIGFFADKDQLYSNVTGNNWAFPILSASTKIILPSALNANDLTVTTYQGVTNSKESVPFTITTEAGTANVTIQSTKKLNPGEGLSYTISFPKNKIVEPNQVQKFGTFIIDNFGLLLAYITAIFGLLFYIIMWVTVGKDKGTRVTVVQFAPTKGVSAGATRYLTEMEYDTKVLSAAIIELAVSGHVKIVEANASEVLSKLLSSNPKISKSMSISGAYTIEQVDGADKTHLSDDQTALLSSLFAGGSSSFNFDPGNFRQVQSLVASYKRAVEKQYTGYFRNNYFVFIIGLLLSIVAIGWIQAQFLVFQAGKEFILPLVAMVVAAVVLYLLNIRAVVNSTKFGDILTSPGKFVRLIIAFVLLIAITAFSALFNGVLYVFIFGLLGLAHVVIFYAIRARTSTGSETQNGLDGFKKYLTLAEEDRIKFFNNELPHDIKTYEKYLPYAVAFDIETQWTKEFDETIKKAEADGYQPSWYSGYNIGYFGNNFANSFGSAMTTAISTSSVDPTSSSSSGGSGGGGGSSGGGGW